MKKRKTVLITGAGGGLGTALTDVFAQGCYNLILNTRSSKVRVPSGVRCDVVYGDLRDDSVMTDLYFKVKSCGLDVLINNAGVYSSDFFSRVSCQRLKETIDVNLVVPMRLTRLLWAFLSKKKSGVVVNINSIAGKEGSSGESIYCASKHGLSGFSKALQFDAVRDGVRVVDVYLGSMNTEMNSEKDWSLLIDPLEVASVIFDLCRSYKSLRIPEITLLRSNYS